MRQSSTLNEKPSLTKNDAGVLFLSREVVKQGWSSNVSEGILALDEKLG